MTAEDEALHVAVQVSHSQDGAPFGSVAVESVDASGEVVAQAMTGSE